MRTSIHWICHFISVECGNCVQLNRNCRSTQSTLINFTSASTMDNDFGSHAAYMVVHSYATRQPVAHFNFINYIIHLCGSHLIWIWIWSRLRVLCACVCVVCCITRHLLFLIRFRFFFKLQSIKAMTTSGRTTTAHTAHTKLHFNICRIQFHSTFHFSGRRRRRHRRRRRRRRCLGSAACAIVKCARSPISPSSESFVFDVSFDFDGTKQHNKTTRRGSVYSIRHEWWACV